MTISEAIEQYEGVAFSYGEIDCCLFVCNVIRDVTGIDYGAPWRGRYSTELGAAKQVKRHRNMAGIASAAFGKLRPIWSVKAGDPVLLAPEQVERDSIGEGLGIYDGTDLVMMTEKGLHRAKIMSGLGCWNV